MGFGTVSLKLLSGLLSTLFAIAGIGLVVYGSFSAFLILVSNSPQVLREYGTVIPSLLTIIFGILLIIFVFLGCCGVCRESVCCTETYSSFLILLALAHFALGAYCSIVYKPDSNTVRLLINQYENDIGKYVENYQNDRKTMDDIQDWLTCCGNKFPLEEYNFAPNELPNGNELPASCCENQVICNKNSADRYKDGCYDSVLEFTVGTNIILGWISLAVGGTELIAALLGICLSCGIFRKRSITWS